MTPRTPRTLLAAALLLAACMVSALLIPGAANAQQVETSPIILNEWNAVDKELFLKNGGADSALGIVLGNGGDWFELVVVEDGVDLRGWTLELSDKNNDLALQEITDAFVFADALVLADLRAGTIITVSEDIADDVSYNPAADDWHINLQANSDDAGAYFTADSQSNFGVNNEDWQLTIRDAAGAVIFGPAGEGVGGASGVSDEEIGELEADPSPFITAASGYDDGNASTFGTPNEFEGRLQDFSLIRPVLTANPLDDGRVVFLTNVASSRYLDGDGVHRSWNVDTSPTGRFDARWRLEDNSDGTWSLLNRRRTRYLDGDGPGQNWNVSGSTQLKADDRWEIVSLDDGSFTLRNVFYDRYLHQNANRNVDLVDSGGDDTIEDAIRWVIAPVKP